MRWSQVCVLPLFAKCALSCRRWLERSLGIARKRYALMKQECQQVRPRQLSLHLGWSKCRRLCQVRISRWIRFFGTVFAWIKWSDNFRDEMNSSPGSYHVLRLGSASVLSDNPASLGDQCFQFGLAFFRRCLFWKSLSNRLLNSLEIIVSCASKLVLNAFQASWKPPDQELVAGCQAIGCKSWCPFLPIRQSADSAAARQLGRKKAYPNRNEVMGKMKIPSFTPYFWEQQYLSHLLSATMLHFPTV